MSHVLPEYVYLVTVSTEWPVSAIADDHLSTPDRLEREVKRRMESANVYDRSQVKIWRVRTHDNEEMELLPAAVIRPSLRPVEKPNYQPTDNAQEGT